MKKSMVFLAMLIFPLWTFAEHAFTGIFYNDHYGIVVETYTRDGILYVEGLSRHHRDRFFRTCKNEFEDRSGRRVRFRNDRKFVLTEGFHGHKMVFKRLQRRNHAKRGNQYNTSRHWRTGNSYRSPYDHYDRYRDGRRRDSCR